MPALSRRRASFGWAAGVLLAAVAIGVYVAPRSVSESDVRMLCEREARKQASNKLDFSVVGYAQQSYTATFEITTLSGDERLPATCAVSGSAHDPQIVIQVAQAAPRR
jgi:hypothetical protein